MPLTTPLARHSLAAFLVACCALAAGCQNEGIRTFERNIKAQRACADLFASVTDEASSRAAAPKIEATMTELSDAAAAFAKFIREKPDAKANKAKLEKLSKEAQDVGARLARETERLESLTNLSSEFWDAYRLQSARLSPALADSVAAMTKQTIPPGVMDALNRMKAIYEQHGASKIVEFEIPDGPSASADAEALAARLKASAAPGQTVEAITVGAVSAAIFVAPVDDFDALVAKLKPEEIAKKNAPRRYVLVNAQSSPSLASMHDMGSGMGAGSGNMSIEEVRERALANMNQARSEHMERMGLQPLPDRNDPDYIPRLISLLSDQHAPRHDDAVEALLTLTPAEVADAGQRKSIADAFRLLAATSPFGRDDALRGFARWGGKESVPVLIDLLQRSAVFEKQAVLSALGDVPTPEGAAAVVEYLGDFHNHDEAAASLRKMGPVAERAILALLPTDDDDVNLAGVLLLGQVGTEQSLELLTIASRGRNLGVSEAARIAIAKIRSGAAGSASSGAGPLPQTTTAPAPTQASSGLPAALRPLNGAQAGSLAESTETQATADTATTTATGEMRSWTDKSGKFKVDAEFVEITAGRVRLKLKDGKTVTLSLAKLSENDRVYVRDLLKLRRDATSSPAGAW